jgi:hypothetical protein
MTTGAIIYLSLCIGFLVVVTVGGWLVVSYYSKKYRLDD